MSAAQPRARPPRLRVAARWAGVILILLGLVVAATIWAGRPVPPPRPPGPGVARPLGPVKAIEAGRLAAAAPLDDVLQDQGNPVPLPDGSTLWLFADTAHLDQDPRFFLTSSAAVSTPASPAVLRYLSDAAGRPLEFLPRTPAELVATDGAGYSPVWPTGATALPDGRIIISFAAWRVTRSPLTFTFGSAGLFEYRYPGRTRNVPAAARIADRLWSPAEGATGSPVYGDDGYVYFALCPALECYSVRTTPERLTDRTGYTWWTGTGWSASMAQRRRMTFGADRPGRTPAISRLPSSGVYVMTDAPAGGPARRALIWVSDTPYGPWSVPVEVNLPGCVSFGCYAIIAHPQHSEPGRLRIGYATFGREQYIHLADVRVRIERRNGRPVVLPPD